MNHIVLQNKKKEIVGTSTVSPGDFEKLNKYKWHLTNNGYAQSKINNKTVLLHRYIYMNILKIDISYKIIDHIDHNRLNNTRDNLRICSRSENSRNRTKKENTTSKYIGVSFKKSRNLWQTSIKIDVLNTKHATYEDEEHAAYQYDLWCLEFKLNNINNIPKPDNFILYSKRIKKDNLPKGIQIRDKKYRIEIKGKNYGRFNHLEDAIKEMTIIRKNLEDEKLRNITSTPIKRNEKGECIIEIFNKKKEKVCDTIVDEDKYYDLIRYPWHMSHGYISGLIDKKKFLIHRYVLNYSDSYYVDHINGDKLDNRVSNLRIATFVQNCMNRTTTRNSSSQYIGVTYDKRRNKWIAYITFNRERIHLGAFENELDAAICRDTASKKYFQEFCKLNIETPDKKNHSALK